MLWGRAAWGIWWAWDERLTTYLLLWLLYVSYMLVRRFSSTGQTQTLAAVISVFAAIDVPVVYMSIRWWRTQHPSPVFFGGADSGIDPSMKPAFFVNWLGWAMWGVFLLCLRYGLERHAAGVAHAASRCMPWKPDWRVTHDRRTCNDPAGLALVAASSAYSRHRRLEPSSISS